ncbi:haloacid dehalogenase superfamily, subfamily IA, variant 3 with third motif having DD or ED [Geodermatophilus ruber]|uniref:Haloacid dehalogenase superfamily, subfamily IA, variant 3 with third motif having DD or ED n=2 Tax=Geodermatophilus ruber TaxID=504800 RepID=A0A1I4BWZ7_9ACTN|nr:haloacid dehalogenase superfamily, subfamily IA, variant 3 with third motif having DD or ED [Geodermatophilus ruber]
MDGTLVETEQLWSEALFELAGRLGGRMSDAARERTVGTSMATSLRILYADLGVVRTEALLRADAQWVEDAVGALMARGITWRPGAQQLLAEVRDAGVPTALVTTTPRRLAAIVLRRIAADLGGDPFDLTVCGDEVPARKPDPAPYRLATRALDVDPAACVALEDSLVGVTSALAAGAAVLGVPSLQPLPPAPGLTLRDSLAAVDLAYLAELVGARSLTA